MGKGRRVLLAAIIIAAAGGMVWVLWSSRPPESVYEGKPLEYWLAGYDAWGYNRTHPDGPPPPAREKADQAIRQMGTNILPALLKKLQTKDSKLKITIITLLQKQHFFKVSYWPTSEYWKGYFALSALGLNVSNAVPQLVGILERDPSAFIQMAVPAILGGIGPAAGQAVPVLLRETAHTNATVRNNAICALRQIHAEPKLVIPVLINCLDDPNVMARAQAVGALGAYGKDAQAAVPAMLKLWRSAPVSPANSGAAADQGCVIGILWFTLAPTSPGLSAPDMRRLAEEALQSIDPEAAAKAGVK